MIQKINSVTSAETKDDSSTIADVTTSSPNNAKPNVSSSALRVLNYVKKHNCRIIMRWYCGIQVYKVWKDEKELSYPHINEDVWCEISKYFKQDGDYQQTHFYDFSMSVLLPQLCSNCIYFRNSQEYNKCRSCYFYNNNQQSNFKSV